MSDYQLRGRDDTDNDTGELVYRNTLEEAMEDYLSRRYWWRSLAKVASAGIRSRVEGDKRTERDRGPSNCEGLGFGVE